MDERRFDVFLSYNSAERRAVERIAKRLRRERLDPWWDQWNLVPGGNWQEELVVGLRASGACAVMVGPAGLGDWAREELGVARDLAAKDRSFRIFLVLLPGAPELDDPSLAFVRSRTWVDLRAGVGHAEGIQNLVSAITGVPRQRDVTVGDPGTSPYRGLAAFEEEHAKFFFGREHDVAMVVEKLGHRGEAGLHVTGPGHKASRFLAVLGPSGSGKSSLLRAGLVPAVRRGELAGSDSWKLRVFTPGPRPLTALAAQLARLFPDDVAMQQTLDQLHLDERSLDMAVSVGLSDGRPEDRVVLVIDQFEETFTLSADEDERRAFLSNLLYAATVPEGRAIVILGMRADFYSRFAPYRDLRALAADQQFLVGPLEAEGLRRAIEEPAWLAGVEFEPGLVETILADVGSHPGSLPLLEHVLLELWQRRRGSMLSLDAYVASGGVEGALAKRANAIYTSLNPAQREIARRVLLRLVLPGEGAEVTRKRAEMHELVTRPQDNADVEAVVQALADERLLTVGRDEVSGTRVVDITHEALVSGWPELRGWINEDRDALRAQGHLTEGARHWDRTGGRDEDLYSGARLAYWKERGLGELSEVERTFVEAGRQRESRQRRVARRRARVTVGGIVAALTAVAVVASAGLVQVANQRDVARSRQYAAEASAVLPVDPARSLQLALKAFDTKATDQAEHALRQALSTPGARVSVLRGHEGIVGGASFSPDGTRVVSAGGDGTVRVWEWASGAAPTVLRGHDGGARASGSSFSPDGKRVVSSGADGTVRVWDWASGAEPTVLRGHEGPVFGASFSPDGTRVVSAGQDGTVRVWDLASGAGPTVLRGHQGDVNHASFSPDGKRVVSSGADGTVRVWELASGVGPTVLRGHRGVVPAASFSADGKRVVSAGGTDGTVRVWDWASGAEPTILIGHLGGIFDASFSADGTRVVSAGGDGTVRVWDWASGVETTELRGHQGIVRSASFGPGGNRVVSTGNDGTVRIWALDDLTVLRGHEGGVFGASFSPDGRQVVSTGQDGTVRVWDWASGAEPKVLRNQGLVFGASFSADGRQVVSTGTDGTVRVWNWASGAEPKVLRNGGNQGVVRGASFSPDGKRVVSAGVDDTVRVWDLASGAEPKVLRNLGGVSVASFSPDGTRVVTAGSGGLRVWDWASGVDAKVLKGHLGVVENASFSPDGTKLVSGDLVGGVLLWNLASSAEPVLLTAQRVTVFSGGVFDASFSPDGTRVVVVGFDGLVWIRKCLACAPLRDLVLLARSPVLP